MYPEGIVTAIITPLKDGVEVDEDGVSSLINFLIEKGVKGFFVLGTYGEGILVSKDERERMLEKVVETVPDKTSVIAHVGATDVKTALELAKHAANLGIGAISSVGPIYHKPGKEGLISYYSYLSKAGAPLMVYNNKGRQGYNISPNDFESIVREVPSVIGIKDTSYDVEQLQNYIDVFGKTHYVAGAGDSLIAVTFLIGAKAHVCGIANAFPEIPLSVYSAVKNGDVKKAFELQGVVNRIRRELSKFGVETQVVLREILRLRGVDIGSSPIQLRRLTEEEKLEVKRFSEPYIEYAESLRLER
ncbi:MAG: dihydrodipicolinate synthase family protein [Candidatus Brockarchaeota archaeon]|nr:dihydrodipicolinate synthase family protein [Candidatus Brockarchaeota archaeon]